MKKLLLLLILATSLLLGLSHVQAQSSSNEVGLSLAPAIVEVAGDPGAQHKTQVTITNISERPIPVSAAVDSLIPIDNEIDRSRRAEFDASSWVKISKNNLVLAPGQSATIDAEVNIPQEANPGGHYAQIGFRILSEANFNPNAQIVPEVSAAIFITVSGDVNEYAEFNTDDIVSSYVTKGSDQKLQFMIRNLGNVHILPTPKVTIYNDSGDIAQFNLQPQLVLPNTEKPFTVDWPADVGYGNYKARVETVYGSQNIPLSSVPADFRVGPAWWQALLVATVLVPISFLLFRHRRLPNAFKALRGKRINLVSKKKYSNVSTDSVVSKSPETVGDYATVSDFLSESKPTKKIEVPQYPGPSATPVRPRPVAASAVIAQAMSKTADEPITEVQASPQATITELNDVDDKDSKTVIVQTSASTIIRQEPLKEPEKKVELPPTIVRAEPPPKPVIKIQVSYGDPQIKPPAPTPVKPVTPKTRSEQVAKKAAAAKRKVSKKKL